MDTLHMIIAVSLPPCVLFFFVLLAGDMMAAFCDGWKLVLVGDMSDGGNQVTR